METSCQNIPHGIGREDLERCLSQGRADLPLHGELGRANSNGCGSHLFESTCRGCK